MAPPPIRRHHAALHIIPAAAAEDAVVAVDAGVVDVVAPFPDVAEQVVQAPGIGCQLADGLGGAAGIAFVPGDRVEVAVTHARGAGAAGVFPFGFGRQAEAIGLCIKVLVAAGGVQVVRRREARAQGQGVAKAHGIEPGDAFDGVLRAGEGAGRRARDRVVERLRDGEL